MSTQAITLELPLSLYQTFKGRAERARRSVEVEILEFVASAAEDLGDLPADLAEAVEGLGVLNDEALWAAARNRVPVEQSEELEALNLKQQAEGLTQGERQRQEQLLHACDRVMLVRANAARILKERGHDVSVLLHS